MRTLARALVVPVLLAALAARPAAAVTATEVDALVREEVGKRKIPGCSVAVVKDGAVVLAKGYGFADVELKVPATAATVFELGSVTKQFTSTLVLMLAEEGKLTLEDSVGKHVLGVPYTWKRVTLRQLLGHTSGIPSYTSLPDFFDVPCKAYTHEEMIALVADKPLDFEPGTKWSYSNTGYFLLGMVVEKAAGKPYCDLAQERIFGPLGMTSTRCNDVAAIIESRAAGYTTGETGLENAPQISMTQPFAAGVLVSTAEDMVKWDAALAAGKLLSAASWSDAWSSALLPDGRPTGYGLGWSVAQPMGHRMVAHDGGIPGFSSSIQRWLDEKLTVVVLANSDAVPAGLVARAVAGLWMPDLVQVAAAIEDTDPGLTARLKAVLEATAAGTVTPEEFTPETAAILFPDLVKQAGKQFASFGPLLSLELLAREPLGDATALRYRATYAKLALTALFVVKPDGKLAGMQLLPE